MAYLNRVFDLVLESADFDDVVLRGDFGGVGDGRLLLPKFELVAFDFLARRQKRLVPRDHQLTRRDGLQTEPRDGYRHWMGWIKERGGVNQL